MRTASRAGWAVAEAGGLEAGGGGGGASDVRQGGSELSGRVVVDGATGVLWESGVRVGDGQVVLTWIVNPPTTTTTTTSTVPAGDPAPVPGPAASYGENAKAGVSTLTANSGGSVTISGAGWAPHSEVTVTVHSDPVRLGTATAGADGAFVATFTLPASVLAGDHHVVLTGTGADGAPATATLALVVTGADQAAAPLNFTC